MLLYDLRKLQNNLLSCDCTTRWLGQWIKNNLANVDQPTTITCNFPESLSGHQIQNLTSDEFVCGEYMIPFVPCAASKWSLMVLSVAPTLIQGPSNETIRTTRELTLLCEVSSIPRPDFAWTRDGVVIEPDESRVTVKESGSLVISSVQLTDAGNYVCNASNLEGIIVSSPATVIVEG